MSSTTDYDDTLEGAPSRPRGAATISAQRATEIRKSQQYKKAKADFRAACARKRFSDGSVGEPCWLCGTQIDYRLCVAPDTLVLCADLVWRPAGDLIPGERVVAFDERTRGDGSWRKFQNATVRKAARLVADCMTLVMSDGTTVTCSIGHRWLIQSGRTLRWKTAENLALGDTLISVGKPWSMDTTREGGYLAGIFDGEGYVGSTVRSLGFAQKPGAVLDRSLEALKQLEIPYAAYSRSKDDVVSVVVRGGVWNSVQLLGSIRPARLMEKASLLWEGSAVGRSGARKVQVVEIVSAAEQEVVSLETSEATFIANGLLSHNSYPHPYSFSLDHAITVKERPELALDPLNFRASHLDCNIARGTDDPKIDIGTPSELW